MRFSLTRPRLEQRPRRKGIDVARLDRARQAAHRELTRPRVL